MQKLVPLFSFILLATLASSAGRADDSLTLRGVDISTLPRVQATGARFAAGDTVGDALRILKDAGANTIRLRLWHTPAGGHCGRAATLILAERVHQMGLRLLLDIHYSDTWADPAHQQPPAAWRGLTAEVLADSARIYTRDILLDLRQRGINPVMVQLGNEITGGLLWDTGRVTGPRDTPEQWDRLAMLLKAGAEGVGEAFPGRGAPAIMLHLDAGGNNSACRHFLDRVLERGVPCEAIGLSYYPWWHGTLEDLQRNLTDLATRYTRPLVVVETAYPWTLGWFDDTHNPVGQQEHLLPGFPATPEGQAAYLEALRQVMTAVPDGLGQGLIYWEPAWIATPGYGSSWENLTLFDERGAALSGLGFLRP